MRQAISALCLSIPASGAVIGRRFVRPSGAQAGADHNTLGVARADASSGAQVPVDVLGTAIVTVGAAVIAGATLKSDANGKAITWAASGAKIAVALEAATGADQDIEVLLIPNVA
ncbi:MAG: DUF2190 family protein [Burkholderiales bacterium]|nr:DUF2190 family protein [Burkholderiales bacterium]